MFLPGESQGQGSLVAAVYGVAQSRTQLKRLSSSHSSFIKTDNGPAYISKQFLQSFSIKHIIDIRYNPQAQDCAVDLNEHITH